MFIKNRVNKINDRKKLGGGREYLNQAMDMMDRHSKLARMVKGIMVNRKSGGNIIGRQEKISQRMQGNILPYSDYVSLEQGEEESYKLNKDLRRYFNITNEVGIQDSN
jgi:hypothetical protein